ncbi:MAG: hypothetical protein ACXVCP_04105 [Bdellovibrio sp.]
MSIDKEIVEDFINESKTLIEEMQDLLESIEGDYSQVSRLADYGNSVDRIMGGSKNLALLVSADHALHMISDYTALCKVVGYKASQIKNNQQLFDICVALLLDATETLDTLLDNLDKEAKTLRDTIPQAFIERLRWISNQFRGDYNISVGSGGTAETPRLQQGDIDDLLKKLGL